MHEVTPEMIDEVFSETTPESALLCTIDGEGLDEPLYLTTHDGGLESRLQFYEFFPFSFAFNGAGQDDIVREAKLEIVNRDARIANAVRTVTGRPSVTIELVRLEAPDDVEMALVGALPSSIEIDDPKVTATLQPRSYTQEPACKARYVSARTPGLF